MPDPENLFLPLILLFIISVVLIIVAIVNIISNKKFMQSFKESMNSDYNQYKVKLKEQNDVFAKQLLEQYKQMMSNGDNSEDNTEKALFGTFLKLRGAIKENCVSAMNKINAARLAIYLLHNGVYSTHGINFFKMSCICEKVAVGSGVRERMIEHTNIPINLFDEMIDKIITNNRYIIMNNDAVQSTNHKIFISSDKIKYAQLIAIYDVNNNMLGFVLAEMDHSYTKDSADKEKECLDELVKQLVPVLSYSDYITMK